MADQKKTSRKKATTSKRNEKVENSRETAQEQPVENVAVQENRSWDIGAVFWGMILIAFGALLLLGNLGVVEVNWSELWRLWPLLVIAAGFSVLAATHWIWKIVASVFVLVAIAAVVLVGTGVYQTESGDRSEQDISVRSERDITNAEVTIRAGASSLNVESGDISEVVRGELESEGLRLERESTRNGSTQKVTLSTSAEKTLWFNPRQNNWDVTLTERLPLKLTIDAGASDIDADLTNAEVTDLDVKAGASRTMITLGGRSQTVNASIDSGASSTTIRVPRDSGVELTFDGGLSSRNFEGLNEVEEGLYRSNDFDNAENKIYLKVRAGLASFTLERF